MITAKILVPDVETLERAKEGMEIYGLKYRYSRKTDPYIHVNIETAEDAEHLFWLGANLAIPKFKGSLSQSRY